MKTNYRIIIYTLSIMLVAMLLHCIDTNKHYKELATKHSDLREQYIELKELYELSEDDYNMIVEENQLFSSMLGAIESEPGGSEILQKLFEEFHNHEIE